MIVAARAAIRAVVIAIAYVVLPLAAGAACATLPRPHDESGVRVTLAAIAARISEAADLLEAAGGDREKIAFARQLLDAAFETAADGDLFEARERLVQATMTLRAVLEELGDRADNRAAQALAAAERLLGM